MKQYNFGSQIIGTHCQAHLCFWPDQTLWQPSLHPQAPYPDARRS